MAKRAVLKTIKILRSVHISLRTKIILSMAGLVIVSAAVSLLVSNFVIRNQTQKLEESAKRVTPLVQEAIRQNTPAVNSVLQQVRQILENNPDNPDKALDQIKHTIYSAGFDNMVFLRLLRDSGFPTSKICVIPPELGARPGENGSPADPGATPLGPGYRPTGSATGSNRDRCATNEDPVGNFYSSEIGQSIALGSLIPALCAIAIGFLISRQIIRPLRMLEKASERIAAGNYNEEIKLAGRDELALLAHSFNQMAQALRLTEQKRKDLLANVSHELRTPLSSIQGYTEVLRDGLVATPDRRNEIFDHILKEVKHLTAMVNSLRTWVNNEKALEHLDIEIMPVRPIAEMVLDRFQPAAINQGIELKLEMAQPEPQVRADSDALSHILSNLVDNALRYTPGGGQIKIGVSQTTDVDGKTPRVRFAVQDSGCGIAPEHLPFLFERFYRVDKSRDHTTGGTGLGLAIVRDTVHVLGGDVSIESEPGRGTTVLFHLPAYVPPHLPASKKRVLALKAG